MLVIKIPSDRIKLTMKKVLIEKMSRRGVA